MLMHPDGVRKAAGEERFKGDMKAKYRAMITAGKPAKVAFKTIMRKPISLANALLRASQTSTEKMA